MKREDLKQLAIEAGFDVAGVQEFLVATGLEGTQDHKLRKLISLVEQATLERAAEECERTFFGNAGELNHEIAEAIRALKDSHD